MRATVTTTSTEPQARAPGKFDEMIAIGLATVVSALAVFYVVVPLAQILIAWQVVAIVYLILQFTTFSNRTMRDAPVGSRPLPRKVLEYLSWVLPIAASGTGIASAVTLLTTEGTNGTGSSAGVFVGLLGSTGVVVAWLLLQAGFAEIYESVYERLPDATMISFPGTGEDPTLGDFLYLSFSVGTTFATSGVTISSRKVRRVVLLHSVTSFFYNAFLIAVAIQVVQGIIANS